MIEWFWVNVESRQDCVKSAWLFNVYIDGLVRVVNTSPENTGLSAITYIKTDGIPISKSCNDVRIFHRVGYCSNHVLPDIRFINMKFVWIKYNGNVMAHLCVPIRIIV